MPRCFLVDNGSLRASAILNLRRIASALSEESGHPILPVSLLHSRKVDPEELNGEPAETLERALVRFLEEGERDFLVVPLFFGPSQAITSYFPKRVAILGRRYPDIQIRVAPFLFDSFGTNDLRLARILADGVEEILGKEGEEAAVVLVDHGSPAAEVTYVRNFVAGQLSALLGNRVTRVAAASMERREGEIYRFNEPLLEDVLREDGFNRGRVILSMLFLSPGRHAGEGGDIWTICRKAEENSPDLKIEMTDLVGNHPGLIPILCDRLSAGLESSPLEIRTPPEP